MRRALLVLSLVGLTVLASAGAANAQPRGYGVGWGNSMGWGSGGYYPQAGYYGSYYGGGGFSPYNQVYGYGYSPYYYNTGPNYMVNPASYYSQQAVMTPTRVVQSFYSDPARAQQSVAVTVVVPSATAQVWFENTLTTQQGTERLFQSPALEPGQNYTYTIKARWTANGKAVERDRQVNVQAGQRITVNFRDNPSETVPAPAATPSDQPPVPK
jgi:uncharacterized protein (TIGR03000 family)